MIEVSHVTCRYGDKTAVDDLSFVIERGRIYGFLGPNGAGKSTTLNIITGCLAASEGTVTVDGFDILENPREAKRRIGYLPETPPVYTDMTVREYLAFVAGAKGVPAAGRKEQIAHAIAVTETGEYADRLIRTLSKGYRQRVGIAQALIGDPDVIILDEPTVGLDPKQIIGIRELIRSLGKTHTVILSSHILAEVRAVCDAVLILSHGRLVANDTPERLEELFAGSSTLSLTVGADAESTRTLLSSLSGVERMEISENADASTDVILYSAAGEDLREAVFFALCDARVPLLRMVREQASLEEIFLELTGGDEVPENHDKEDCP